MTRAKRKHCDFQMTLADFTEFHLLVPELLNERQESAIVELSNRLKEAGRVANARTFTRAVLKHESLVSTVFDGVAFSLARGHTALELSFAIGLSKHGVLWGSPKASPVFMAVLFAIPDSAEETYLSVIMAFSVLLRNKTLFQRMGRAKTPEEMFEVLSRTSCREMRRD